MKTYKVLICIANIGGGHIAPAKAIEAALKKNDKAQFEVKIIDLFKQADAAPYNTADAAYQLMTDNWTLQHVNNLVFRTVNFGFSIYESYLLTRLLKPTLQILDEEKPDLVIANHPDVSTALNGARKSRGRFFYASQVTDAKIFLRGAISPAADVILAPTQDAIDVCLESGIKKKKIIGPGFTTGDHFGRKFGREKFLSEIGFVSEKPIIMLTGGGIGLKSVVDAVEQLVRNPEWQLMVMCGRVSSLAEVLRNRYSGVKQLRVFDFVDNMPDFYSAADVVIAKPGMSTVIETEMLKKRVIYTQPVAEQERGNVEYALISPLTRYIGRDWDKLNNLVAELLLLKGIDAEWEPRHKFEDTQRVVDELVERFIAARG